MPEAQETFLSHLIELRERLVRSLIAIGIFLLPALYYSSELYDLLAIPLMHAVPGAAQSVLGFGAFIPRSVPIGADDRAFVPLASEQHDVAPLLRAFWERLQVDPHALL